MKTDKIITCILNTGTGKKLVKALREKGIVATGFYHARGASIGDPVTRKGIPLQGEREVMTTLVSTERADEIFEFLYEAADMHTPGNGFIYMGALDKSSPYQLPDLPEEEAR